MPRLEHVWQTRNPLAWGLLPLAGLFCMVVQVRRVAYGRDWLPRRRLPVPVLVVGNLSVGGTGKTPLVIWLARYLQTRGHRPGILTRGYRGRARDWPRLVKPDTDPMEVGDEAVLLARRGGCPVAAGPDRAAAGCLLLDQRGCDFLICDDGLQHYALARDLEIAVVDGARQFGNGFCLPAGPLREPRGRLRQVDLVVVHGAPGEETPALRLVGDEALNLRDPRQTRPLASWRGQTLTAMAGIGHPERFFQMLRDQGLDIRARPFPDHHGFQPQDLAEAGSGPILMTEKDAVKCEPFAPANVWYLPVVAEPNALFINRFEGLLRGVSHG